MIPLKAQQHLYSATIGFFGGASIGLVGWGGSQIVTPGMTYYPMSLSQISATGISLSSLSVSTITSAIKFLQEDSVAIYTSIAIAIPSVVSARYGTRMAQRLSSDALSLVFNGLSIVMIPTHFFIQQRAQHRKQHALQQQLSPQPSILARNNTVPTATSPIFSGQYDPVPPHLVMQHAAYGAVTGLVSALMGIGGLPFTMSYLTECTTLGHHLVQGTAICAVVPSVLMSTFTRRAAIPWHSVGVVTAGAMLGSYAGAQIALSSSEDQLREMYMASLVLFGSRSVYGSVRNIRSLMVARKR